MLRNLEVIFENAGKWNNYYQFLHHTGLRAGDVALLKISNIDRARKSIVSLVRKSDKFYEFPLADSLIELIPNSNDADTPIFPDLYSDNVKTMNYKLKAPRKHMQTMLKLNGRSHATLHSFRVTFNNTLRDLGLNIDDRRILLAHASTETTKIYTHPNFDLAAQFVNQLPKYNQ